MFFKYLLVSQNIDDVNANVSAEQKKLSEQKIALQYACIAGPVV